MEVIGDSDLRCVVCMDIDGGEIYQCPEGHLICGTCKGKLEEIKCPTCRSVDIENRNRALENIVAVAQQIKKRKVEVDDDVKAVGDAAQQLQAKLNKLKEENEKLNQENTKLKRNHKQMKQNHNNIRAKLKIAKTLDCMSLIYCKYEHRFYETKGNSFVGLDTTIRGCPTIIGWRPLDEDEGKAYDAHELMYLAKYANRDGRCACCEIRKPCCESRKLWAEGLAAVYDSIEMYVKPQE